MSNVLVPYPEFPREVLAAGLLHAVDANETLLDQRHILGPPERYQNEATALESVVSAQRLHEAGWMGAFAVVDSNEQIVGAASIQPSLPLRRLRLPVAPILGGGLFAQKFPNYFPNVQAWAGEDLELLANAYRELRVLATQARYRKSNLWTKGSDVGCWTVEPERSPRVIHEAIQAAGFSADPIKGLYDDAESRRHAPPVGTLYTAPFLSRT